jgi:hypothetical protein
VRRECFLVDLLSRISCEKQVVAHTGSIQLKEIFP